MWVAAMRVQQSEARVRLCRHMRAMSPLRFAVGGPRAEPQLHLWTAVGQLLPRGWSLARACL